MVEDEEVDFETSDVNHDGEYNQTSDTRNPVADVCSLRICQTDELHKEGQPFLRTTGIRKSPNLFHKSSMV